MTDNLGRDGTLECEHPIDLLKDITEFGDTHERKLCLKCDATIEGELTWLGRSFAHRMEKEIKKKKEEQMGQPNYTIEIHIDDGASPPDQDGLNVNSTVVWVKARGEWYTVETRGAYQTLNDMLEIVGAKKWPESHS